MRGTLGLAAALVLIWGCSSSDEDGTSGQPPVRLTTEVTLAPVLAPMDPPDSRVPSNVEQREAMLAEGYGELGEAPGEPHVTRAPPGQTAPAPGAGSKLLVRFVHMPDLQINDDESPTRLAGLDSPGATAGAFRPQDHDLCRMTNAAVKTTNALHEATPIDFLLLGGDNADSAQQNEVDWVLGILSGGSMECDSGADDDPIPGANNDGKDPFEAPGLLPPWYWVTGNHDVLVQGNLPVNASNEQKVLGENAPGKTRDWSQAGGPLFTGPVTADPDRHLLTRAELMQRISNDGAHGVGADQIASGKAIYTFDVEGTPLRFLILDTAAETGGAEGVLHQADIDQVIRPALDQALADGKWVSLASHHATSSLTDGGGLGGEVQADAVLEDAWLSLLAGYPNVVFSFVGHSHENRVKYLEPPSGGGFWEVMTSALADFPHQLRIVEIWDQDNGWLMLRATNVDFATFGDPAAAEGRSLGTLEHVAGWTPANAAGTPEDRNVEVWIPKP